jgi:hypothetical protein
MMILAFFSRKYITTGEVDSVGACLGQDGSGRACGGKQEENTDDRNLHFVACFVVVCGWKSKKKNV